MSFFKKSLKPKLDETYSDKEHNHGNISKDGKITGQASKNVVTDAQGNITTENKPTVDSALSSTSTNAVQNKVVNTALSGKAASSHTHPKSQITDFPTLSTVATSGSYNDLSNKPSLSSLGGTVTVEKQTTPEGTNFSTYVVKQNGTQVGEKINIPKDFVVKSGSVKTAPASPSATLTAAGVGANEKYISLIINTADNNTSTGNSELIIPAKDLIESVVTFSQTQTNGTNTYEIGKITINGVTTTIYGKDTNTTYTAESTATNIKMNGTQSAGSLSTYAKGDHIHPTDTSRAPTAHAVNATTYGVSTTGVYGHSKLVENLTTDAGNGLALGAGQGKALKALVDAKVNTTDIKDNLTSTDTNKPLSAKQGKELKTQIDNIISGKTATDHNHDGRYYTETEIDTKLNGKVNTNDSRLTDARTPTSHTHGNITNAGAIGSTANKPLITTSNGVITTGNWASSTTTDANYFVAANDSRLSNTRTPTDGTVTTAKIVDKAVTDAKLANYEYINGTQASATSAWTGVTTKLTSTTIPTGTIIYYRLNQNSTSTNATLELKLSSDNTKTTGAKAVYLDDRKVTTHFRLGSIIPLRFDGTNWIVISPYTDTNTTYTADNSTLELSSTQFKVKDGGITSAKIANGTIVNEDIANTTITGGKLVNGTITATQLASNAVETAKIKDANVTNAKLADPSNIVTEYIVGTHGTTATNAWTGTSTKINSLSAGQVIFFKMTSAGTSSAATLNLTLANGTTTGAKNIRYNSATNLTTHFPINTVLELVYDGTYWVCTAIQNTNNYDRVSSTSNIVNGESSEVAAYTLMWGKTDKKYYKIAANGVFNIRYPIVWLGGKLASGAATNNVYSLYSGVNLQNTISGKTVTTNQQVYVEGTTFNNGNFTVSSNVFVSEGSLTNGRYYVPIGQSYSTTNIRLNATNQQVYYYDGTNLKPVEDYKYQPAGNYAASNHNHDYSKVSVSPTKTSGIEIGRITVDGTEKILYQQDNNNTYSTATQSANGLMSSSDKTKLDGIDNEANKTTIANNLTTTTTGSALDATQGKALNTALEGKAPKSHAVNSSTYGLGTSSVYGHTKATSSAGAIDTFAGSAGTDNSLYARGDHSHPRFDFRGMKGTDNTVGYVKFLQLKINTGYQDKPIAIEIFQRDRTEKTTVQIKYNNNGSIDPTLQSITHTGQNIDIFLYKSGSSTWELICSKGHSDKYGEMVVKIDNPNTGINITSLDTHIASVPSGAEQSTFIGFTSAEKTKLAGIATSANNYSHPNSGVTAGTNYNGNQTPSFGGTFNIPKLTFNAQGHITASANSTVTIPSLPTANSNTAGILKVSDSTSTTSSTVAASSTAVKAAYDLANGKPSLGTTNTTAAKGDHNHDGTYLKSYTPPTASTNQAGIVQLNSATNSTSTTQAATPSAVKAAYDLANGKPSLGTTSTTAAKGDHNHDSTYATSSHTHGFITNDGKIVDGDSGFNENNKPVVRLNLSGSGYNGMLSVSTVSSKHIQDVNAHTNIGSSADATQETINRKIDIALGNIWKKIYPVGSIYISVDNTSPATLFGGTWVQLKDRFLLGVGDTYTTVEETGGSKDSIVVEHNHGNAWKQVASLTGGNSYHVAVSRNDSGATTGQSTGIIANEGVDGTDANMPPYLTVYMWKRTE